MTAVAVKYNRKDQASVDTLRLLAVDMVETAKSGHPGLPLGAAPLAYVLWTRFLVHDPKAPNWPNRDRFILSPGHGSALIYAFLHLAGYGLTIDDLKNFRQFGSPTPGHPEYGHTAGIEATTGPLGHGFAMGVGMALAQRVLAARFNKPGFNLFDHYIYAIVSDGDLMEGVASEAASFAGAQGLSKLVYLYDDNHITIEGGTDITFTEDVRSRFLAYGWQVIVVSTGDDLPAVQLAIENARAEKEKPTLVMCRTKIGAGSPKEGTAGAHGEPLGPQALAATRERYGYGDKPPFFVDERVAENFRKYAESHRVTRTNWEKLLADYAVQYPSEHSELARVLSKELPVEFEDLSKLTFDKGAIATRNASGTVINAIARLVPEFIGGSADLAPSNKTMINGQGSLLALSPTGRNIHFGIREHGMGAVLNGMALYGGLIPFGGTFLVFSDFVRPAIRLSALMGLKVIYVFTHDSVGVGEDGPTHQPIEHLASLRIIPNLVVLRPADAYETLASWKIALKRQGPSALILSRQNLTVLHPDDFPSVVDGPNHGGYVLRDSEGGEPQAIIIATGSEVSLALKAQDLLASKIRVRVASIPSWEIFAGQHKDYIDSVLPPKITCRLGLEAARGFGWERFLGPQGEMLSIERFGFSAPADRIFEELGFTPENVAARIEALLSK
ncbi:MAG: transketolase [Deltaproteobacteria bacterium]|nr:transketolase [Deltaproteobacteria bacterium]